MNRVPTIAAVTGGLLVLGGVVAGGIAIAGEDAPAPTPAYVTVDDSPRAGLANTQQTPGDRDCPKGPAAEGGAAEGGAAEGGAAEGGAAEGGAAEGGAVPVTNL